jgi:hypothetical protein
MPTIFSKEAAQGAAQFQDRGKLVEIDQHELLRVDDGNEQIATFDQVKEVGRLFMSQKFNSVLPSSQPLPEGLLKRHELIGGAGVFWGKLALGADLESQFPVTIEIVSTQSGRDLRLHIVPIHFGALEVAQFGQHTDSLLALAAAAAVAPQFVLALEGGITTTHCATKKDVVTSITPDHGTPLAVTFDAFAHSHQTLNTAISVTGDRALSIKQAAHLHGQDKPDTQQISQAAAGSKIAAGVPLRTVLRSELPRHALFIQTTGDGFGNQKIVSVEESLLTAGIESGDLSFLAAALGFTARVVGDAAREHTIEKVLKPTNADTPLAELVRE